MPVSDVRGLPFPTTLEILGLFPYLAERQTFIPKLRSITPYFRPRAWVLTPGYLVRIERLSGKRRGKLAGGFPRSKEKWCEAEVHRAAGDSRTQVARARSRKRQKHILIAHSR
jgi:hypothetical protein